MGRIKLGKTQSRRKRNSRYYLHRKERVGSISSSQHSENGSSAHDHEAEVPEPPDYLNIIQDENLLPDQNFHEDSSSADSVEDTNCELIQELGTFFNEHKLTHRAVKQLTNILRSHNPEWRHLPTDLRTYVSRSSGNKPFEIENETFIYIGIERQLENRDLPDEGCIQISLSTDGFPLGKSTPMEVWPVLMATENEPNVVSVICVYVGTTKPKVDELAARLVIELEHLLENGINGRKVIIIYFNVIINFDLIY